MATRRKTPPPAPPAAAMAPPSLDVVQASIRQMESDFRGERRPVHLGRLADQLEGVVIDERKRLSDDGLQSLMEAIALLRVQQGREDFMNQNIDAATR